MSIAPIVQTVQVKANPARAFELFTTRMVQWWPAGSTIGRNSHVAIVTEPRVDGRWFERDAEGNVWPRGVDRALGASAGTFLYETQAILRYLDRLIPTPALTPASTTSSGFNASSLRDCSATRPSLPATRSRWRT